MKKTIRPLVWSGFLVMLLTTVGWALVLSDLTAEEPLPHAIWLESLDLSRVFQVNGVPQVAKTVLGNPIVLGGVAFPHGIGTHTPSEIIVELNGGVKSFYVAVGISKCNGEGSAIFKVYVDGSQAAYTGLMREIDTPRVLEVNVSGARWLRLVADPGDGKINCDHVNWGGAMLVLDPNATSKPQIRSSVANEPSIEMASVESSTPAFHSPRVVGTTPGRPFLFLLPATGQGPLAFKAKRLPKGLVLDSRTGVISGSLKKEGTYHVKLRVEGPGGKAEGELIIIGGANKLAQTPPMGWSSWNVWGKKVDDHKIRQAIDALIQTGLAGHGYQQVNIDDTWMAGRDAQGRILPNDKFPDMKALADYAHSKGLKLGIYSSPGKKTCEGYEGSLGHEVQDAQTYAAWGIDYLKYDWCSAEDALKEGILANRRDPYRLMAEALRSCDRDIVFSVCQYGTEDVWTWGAEVGGNLWRTTGDLFDVWDSLNRIGFSQDGLADYAGPGHWNDPDMLAVGVLGWGNLHPTRLSPNEQITHITLWSLLAAPLMIGCDLTQLDAFTMALLSNDEVIAVDQDRLGKGARRVAQVIKKHTEVWARPLDDGALAVGLFNRADQRQTVTISWKDLSLSGQQPVRNLWSRKDLGIFEGEFSMEVPAHGAQMIKVGTSH